MDARRAISARALNRRTVFLAGIFASALARWSGVLFLQEMNWK